MAFGGDIDLLYTVAMRVSPSFRPFNSGPAYQYQLSNNQLKTVITEARFQLPGACEFYVHARVPNFTTMTPYLGQC